MFAQPEEVNGRLLKEQLQLIKVSFMAETISIIGPLLVSWTAGFHQECAPGSNSTDWATTYLLADYRKGAGVTPQKNTEFNREISN
jgi:hypothetical protein